MAVFSMSQRIKASQEVVFDTSADVHSWAEQISAVTRMEVLTDGPVGVGTRFRETRVMFGKEHTEEMEVTAFERPHGYRLEGGSCGCHYGTDIEIKPDGGDAVVISMTMRTTPLTFMAKLMTPLGVLMSGTMKKCIQKDLDELRANIEGDAGAAAAPA